jgi:uncharacterized protein (DUF1697 family)
MPATKRYAAFLRGVMPTNAKMPELRRAFEGAGFVEVSTALGSGNVVFAATAAPAGALERKAEAAMQAHLGRTFMTIVRPVDALREMLERDPFRGFRLKPDSKRIVTFLRARPKAGLALPIELDRARILRVEGREAFSVYLPNPRGPVFMTLLERTFGTEITTRTWDTVIKVAKVGR